MDHEIEMEETSNDRIAQHFQFPFFVEDDFPKSETRRVESDSDYSSYVTSSVFLSPAKSDSSGSSNEGLGLSIPHSSPSKLQQDNCHHANHIPVTPIMARPASDRQTDQQTLCSAGSEIKSIDKKGQERAEDAKGPQNNTTPTADDHLAATMKLFPEPSFSQIDYGFSIPIFPESSLNKVEGEHDLYPPYMPLGSDGPPITMCNAIDILNRYCVKLTNGMPLSESPVWAEDTIYPKKADPKWLYTLYTTFKPTTPFVWLYRRRLFLPRNSPLREVVVGDFLPYERCAKRMAAYKACIQLHKLGELGDDLRPVTEVVPLRYQPSAAVNDELSGTSKGKQCRHKKTSDVKRMEVLGDALLKLAISIFVYDQSTRSRKCTEDWLTSLRMHQICDRNLNRLGKNPELGSTIIAEEFGLKTNLLPPCVSMVGEHNNKQVYQMDSNKNIAGCVKALAGASLLASKMAGAMKFLERIGLETIPEGLENNVNPVNGFPRLANFVRLPSPKNEDDPHYPDLCRGLDELQDKINYAFNDKTLLIEALTHPTRYTNRWTVSYERLAFLGDAVLDYLVTRSYFDDKRKFSPADLMDLRSATVKNATFGVLAVRHGFHPFLKYKSSLLFYSLQKFIRIQKRNDHQIPDDYVLLDSYTTVDADISFDVEVSTAYSNIFKSVAGAMFIDSGMSLEAVWERYYPLLHQEMDKFRCNIPKSPIRLLHEKYPGSVFEKKKDLPDGRVCVAVVIEGKSYHGSGWNSKAAKRAAAKYALRDFGTCK